MENVESNNMPFRYANLALSLNHGGEPCFH
jgi:hypothetical protein